MRPHRTERRDKGAPPLCPPGIHPATRRRGGSRGRGTRPLRAKAMRAVPLPQGRCGINGRPPATRAPPI